MKKFLAMLFCVLSVVMLFGCTKSRLEDAAVPEVDKIVAEKKVMLTLFNKKVAKCTKVELADEISEDVWSGKAYFENGKSMDCKVIDKDDQVYVELDFKTLR